MSDTPETDAFQQTEYCAYDSMWRRFAQKLERERDEWKEVAEGSLLGAIHERDAFEKELFYVRGALIDAMPNAHGSTKKLAELLVAERDHWKLEAERWRATK